MSKLFLYQPKFQSFLDDGSVNNAGTVEFYEVGTSTPKDTFSDSSLVTVNANPVVLDSAGRADIVLNGAYKVIVKDSVGVTISTTDNFNPDDIALAGNYNLVTNGSFEDNASGDGKTPDGWTLTEYSGSTVAFDTSTPAHASQALSFTSTGSGGGNIISTSFFEVSPLRKLEVSFQLKSTVVDVRNLVEVVWYTAALALISSTAVYDESDANPTDWDVVVGLVTPPPTARFAKLRMYGCHPSDATAGSTSYDDVYVHVVESISDLTLERSFDPYADIVRIHDDSGDTEVAANFPIAMGSIHGLSTRISTLSGDTDHDIDFSAGACRSSDNTANIVLDAVITKQIDAGWAAGDDAGGLFSGTVTTNTWYHGFVIFNPTTGVSDAGFDTSITAANRPAAFTKYRRVASFLTDGSSNLRNYLQTGDVFQWIALGSLDLDGSTVNTSSLLTVRTPLDVKCLMDGVVMTTGATNGMTLFSDPDVTAPAVSSTAWPMTTIRQAGTDTAIQPFQVMTNTSSQIRHISNTGGNTLRVACLGYRDFRSLT